MSNLYVPQTLGISLLSDRKCSLGYTKKLMANIKSEKLRDASPVSYPHDNA